LRSLEDEDDEELLESESEELDESLLELEALSLIVFIGYRS